MHVNNAKKYWLIMLVVAVLAVLVVGCQGPAGPSGSPGPAGPPGPSGAINGTLSGKVTNSLNAAPVAGVRVALDPAIPNVNITTDASGAFSAQLPIGTYTLNLTKTNFTAAKDSVSVVAGQTTTKNIVMAPVAKVVVNAGAAQTASPGSTVILKATADVLDGSTISGYEWAQVSGIPVTSSTPRADSTTIILPLAAAYKAELLKGLELLDRVGVVGIIPHALVAAETTSFKVTVTTSSGKYTATTNVAASLPYEFTQGINAVPLGVPVVLNGKVNGPYAWTLTGPEGTTAKLDEANARNPVFIPDKSGKFTVTEATSKATIEVYSGTWAGAISGIGTDGKPLSAGCTVCHNGKAAADNFKDWSVTGHAEIFAQNMENPAGHWTEACAVCHVVGYSKTATNGGWDEAMVAAGWQVPPHGDVGLWNQIVTKYPKMASLSNIQCENCHGPNSGSGLHDNGKIDAARVSISSDVCGSCHGEPPRHGRFQQWEESGHGNFEAAIVEGTVENRGATAAHCGRCHTGQGFIAWIKQGDLTKQIQGKSGNATVAELTALGLTKDTVQPVTCSACHDPHEIGTTSGEPGMSNVRIVDNTLLLPAGFKAEVVGKGALCITCHNTRNALHNIDAPPTSYSAPHVASQGDVLMGENAYFVTVGARSAHSYISNTCVTCHLNESPPPAEYSFQLGGTNHAFKASLDICSDCHSGTLSGEGLQLSIEEKLHELAVEMGKYIMDKLPNSIVVKDYSVHEYNNKQYDVKSDAITIAKSAIASMEPVEPHGQQGFIITLKSPASVTYKPANEDAHSIQTTKLEVQLGDITSNGTAPVIPITDPLLKAGWNYYLIHGDASMGIHNPSFSFEVLGASIDALK